MKARHWSLALVLLLINYLIFAALFNRLFQTSFGAGLATRTPVPTFTPAPAEPFIIAPTLTPLPDIPTPTATPVLEENRSGQNSLEEAAAEAMPQAQLVAPGAVNIRAGPGLGYEVIGALNADTVKPIVGRNAEASWWQIEITDNQLGWVANSVVQANHTQAVPVIQIETKPAPAAQPAASTANYDNQTETAPPPVPEPPQYQFSPTGWYDDGNQGVTRFLGDIKDVNGNPVNGVFVRASCGHYSTISYPSGPTGWGTLNESSDWPAGFYDITVDTKPVPCVWILSIIDTDDRKTIKAVLSEEIPVEVTAEKSVIVANWQKNW